MLLVACVVAGLAVFAMTGRAADAGPADTPRSQPVPAAVPVQMVPEAKPSAANDGEELGAEYEGLRSSYEQLAERTRTANANLIAARALASTSPRVDEQANVDTARVLAIDQEYRQALASGNPAAVARFLNDGFLERDPDGKWLNRDAALARIAAGRSIAFELSAIQASADTTIISGRQVETVRTYPTASLVTRVWTRSPNDQWTLLSNTVARSPQPAVAEATSVSPSAVAPRGAMTLPPPPGGVANVPTNEVRPESPMRSAALTSGTMVRVGGDIKEPQKIRDVKPVYPTDALSQGVSGIVIIETVVDASGAVSDARILRGHDLLNQAALDAVQQWRYVPAVLNGVPVSVVMTVTVNFVARQVQPAP